MAIGTSVEHSTSMLLASSMALNVEEHTNHKHYYSDLLSGFSLPVCTED